MMRVREDSFPMALWRWWAFSDRLARVRIALWWLRWKAKGHYRNHDPAFCLHKSKVWRWKMEDGCEGEICDWCHLLEPWCPTILPDVAEIVRLAPAGHALHDWILLPLEDRIAEAWRAAYSATVGHGLCAPGSDSYINN